METAFVMMLVMPKREGGLGIRGLEMDYRIEVNARARHLTARSCFYCDVYLREFIWISSTTDSSTMTRCAPWKMMSENERSGRWGMV